MSNVFVPNVAQVAITVVIVLSATGAAVGHLIEGESLVGIYTLVLGYIFGFNQGHFRGKNDAKRGT